MFACCLFIKKLPEISYLKEWLQALIYLNAVIISNDIRILHQTQVGQQMQLHNRNEHLLIHTFNLGWHSSKRKFVKL